MEQINIYTSKAIELLMQYTPKFLLALIVLFIGIKLINIFEKGLKQGLRKAKTEETLISFMGNLFSWLLKGLLLVSVASMIGISTASFLTLIGAAGLAIGLALQGSLANFAGGVLILFFKPFTAGDLIEAQGHLGIVKEVQIFNTILITPTNKKIIIPNGSLSNGSITNYSTEGKLRVDLIVGIDYGADIKKAKEIILNVLTENQLVLKNPAPLVAVLELADSSVNLAVRPWCKPQDYWKVYFGTMEKIKLALDANNIPIPFPQHDVHLYNHSS